MFTLALLTCIVLRALSAEAKVVASFDECKDFFYKRTEPRGMDQNAKKICHKYEGESTCTYYATLHSVPERIPLYSAYILDPEFSRTASIYCKKNWNIKPQISQPNSQSDHMVLERDADVNVIEGNQAIYSNYDDTVNDHGHLNPNKFQSGTGRTSTCTLTNASPMDPCFKRIHFKNWEIKLRTLLKNNLDSDNGSATAYIVTGTVPGTNERKPHRENPGDSERVTVLSHIWAAVCYKHNIDDRKTFSFGFMGRNQPAETSINLMRMSDLNDRLTELYNQTVTIFADDCGEEKPKTAADGSHCSKIIDNGETCVSGSQTKPCCKETCKFDKTVYGYRCNAFGGMQIPCSPLYSPSTYKGKRCLDDYQCATYGYTYYWCWTGSFQWSYDYCSPPVCCTPFENKKMYSLCSSSCTDDDYMCCTGEGDIIINNSFSAKNGKSCKSDHPCGHYGNNYLWCYTNDNSWDECCTAFDCYSAVSGKTCRADHPCGHYGKKYLWCYLDYKKNWEYCCKDCS